MGISRLAFGLECPQRASSAVGGESGLALAVVSGCGCRAGFEACSAGESLPQPKNGGCRSGETSDNSKTSSLLHEKENL